MLPLLALLQCMCLCIYTVSTSEEETWNQGKRWCPIFNQSPHKALDCIDMSSLSTLTPAPSILMTLHTAIRENHGIPVPHKALDCIYRYVFSLYTHSSPIHIDDTAYSHKEGSW